MSTINAVPQCAGSVPEVASMVHEALGTLANSVLSSLMDSGRR
jgi:hypothetical protein